LRFPSGFRPVEVTGMKRGTSNHPKVYLLAEALKVKRPTALGYLQLLWDFAADYAPEGDVGRYPDSRIEAALDWGGARGKLVAALVQSRWLDVDPTRRFVVHDWLDHAEKSVHRRLERAAKRKQGDTQKVTPIVGVTDAENQTPARVGAPPAFAFNHRQGQSHEDLAARIYARHPNKAAKVMFEQVLAQVLAATADPEALAARIERSHTAWLPVWGRDGGKFAPRLDRWIADSRFLDEPPELPLELTAETGSIEDYRRQELGL
jgi:hypothetical protein